MRPFMIVEPDEGFHSTEPMRKGPAALQRETFIVDGAKEAFDLAIGLGPTRPQQMMRDAQAPAGLLKAGQAIGVLGITHREREGVVGQDRLDGIGQGRDHAFQKGRRGAAGLVGRDVTTASRLKSSTAANS